MGEGVHKQAFQGQAPQLAEHCSHVTHGLFETSVTSPARPPLPRPRRVTAMDCGAEYPQLPHLQFHFLEEYLVCPKPNRKLSGP